MAKLQQNDFTIEHRVRKQHGKADKLSGCGKCKFPQYGGPVKPENSALMWQELKSARYKDKAMVLVPYSGDETHYISFLSSSTKLVTEFNGWTIDQG